MARRKHRRGREVAGLLLLDKPAGMTSNQALQRVKHLYGAAKAGHTGSLDPLATGMLPICFGAATKVSSFLLDAGKAYRVAGRLGVATDTGDADGQTIEQAEPPPIDAAAFEAALEGFRGEIDQTPPMYSALKHEGRRLYALAREGVEVERAARRVRIHELAVERLAPPEFELRVACSKGTYVRTLVTDLAARLGTFGHVTALRRTVVEPFGGAPMHALDALREVAEHGTDALDALLLPADAALARWPRADLNAAAAEALRHGRRVPADPQWPLGQVRVYGPEQAFLGVGEVLAGGELVSRRLFPG